MLQPKRTKYRKSQKSRINGLAYRGSSLAFGSFGLKSLEPGRISAKQIEAVRVVVTKAIKRQGALWVRIFPDKSITKKPAEVRMGKGKGAPEYWVAQVKPGRIMFELDGVDQATAKEAFRLASDKLPIRVGGVSSTGFFFR